MNTEKIKLTIEEKARRYSLIYASLLSDQYQRKRANAAITALFAYTSFLKNSGIDIQNSMTLYRNPNLCEEFEIADFYINNYHIDVRITTSENAVLLPKIHFDNNIIPDFYVVIKVDVSLKTAEFLGVINTKTVKTEPFDYHYYKVNSSEFISNDDFLSSIQTPKTISFNNEDHENFKNYYLSFIDNEIGNQRKNELLRHLFNCAECRTEFCCFTGFEMVSSNAAQYPDLLDDKTLEIVGAQNVDSEKYRGKETTICIDDKNEVEKESQTFQNNSSSAMSEEDYSNDETQMDYVPYTDNPQPNEEEENKEPDLMLISDDETSSENSDMIDDFFNEPAENKSEITPIEENDIFENAPEGYDFKPDDMQIINDDEFDVFAQGEKNNTESQNSDNKEEDANVQKVIIDYNENGEPIYSYITGADGTGPISEIQNIDDNNISDEDFTKEIKTDTSILDNGLNEYSDDLADGVAEYNSGLDKKNEDDVLDFDVNDLKDYNEQNNVEQPEKNNFSTDENLENTILDEVFEPIKDDNETENFDFQTDEIVEQIEEKKSEADESFDDIFGDEVQEIEQETQVNEENSFASEIQNEDELDILDQMFVDGALEREVREQQEISYTSLGGRVDSHITEPVQSEPDTLHVENPQYQEETIKEEENPSENETGILQEEAKELKDDDLTVDTNDENLKVDDYEDFAPDFDNESTIFTEHEPIFDDKNEEQEEENNQKEQSNSKDEKFFDNEETQDEEEDELLSVLPSETNASVQMFDGYIESELAKNSDALNEENEGNNSEIETNKDNKEENDDDEEEENNEEEENDDEEGDEDMNDENSKDSSLKNIIITIGIIAAILLVCGVGAFIYIKNNQTSEQMGMNSNTKDNKDIEIAIGKNDVNSIPIAQNGEIKTIPLESNSAKKSEVQSEDDINKVITNALSSGRNLITLREVNWFCAPALAQDAAFKNYMQNVDNTLKQNLKNNIMGVTEIPPENQVAAKLAVDNERNLRKVVITKTSGSEEVDKIVLQSINETFEGEKSPILTDSPLKADMYLFEVLIKL